MYKGDYDLRVVRAEGDSDARQSSEYVCATAITGEPEVSRKLCGCIVAALRVRPKGTAAAL
jgi:hypothetical protein